MDKTVGFTAMKDGTKEEYELLARLEKPFLALTAERVLEELRSAGETTFEGYQITRLQHGLQSGTRALRDGADIDWIISALLHDIGDLHAPHNHGEYASTILKPYVREQCKWVIATHGAFQMIYYGQHLEKSTQHAREEHRGHRFFQDCVDFCERWDQASFDPNYPDLPLIFFKPMLEEVFSRAPYDPAIVTADPSPLVNSELAAERVK